LVAAKDQFDPAAPTVYRPVEEVFVRTAYLLEIVTLRSSAGIDQTICTTNEHPIHVPGVGWVLARDLRVGDRITQADGGEAVVVATRWEKHPEGVPVYNFRVGQHHTYFVREEGSTAEPVWVHNAKCGPEPNNGEAAQHGSRGHDAAIEAEIDNLPAKAKNIRKNQAQVDVRGNKTGDNRPDLQYDLNGVHHNHEFDYDPVRSNAHAVEIRNNDPASWVHQTFLGS
jgi:hypothetical protein